MASWAIHFQIADYFLDKIPNLNKEYFVIGNIAPDCGIPCETGYDPPSEVTHRANNSHKSESDYESIYNDFIKGENDINKKSFWLGYYVHLFADCQFTYKICKPIKDKHGPISQNKELLQKVKDEWYNLDFEFLEKNKSSSFEIFKNSKGFSENYPDFYKENDITNRMKFIVDFYKFGKPRLMRYTLTKPNDIDAFIFEVPKVIYNELKIKGLLTI